MAGEGGVVGNKATAAAASPGGLRLQQRTPVNTGCWRDCCLISVLLIFVMKKKVGGVLWGKLPLKACERPTLGGKAISLRGGGAGRGRPQV